MKVKKGGRHRKSSGGEYLSVKNAVWLRQVIPLTPAKLADLIDTAVYNEGIAAGHTGELTLGRARQIAKKFKLNKRILGCLEVRVRRDS